MAMTSTTELFEFIHRMVSIWDGDFVKLVLDTSSGDRKAETSLEITATYSSGKNHLFGYAVVIKGRREMRVPLQDVVFPSGNTEYLINEVFKFVQVGYLLQRVMREMQITSATEPKI